MKKILLIFAILIVYSCKKKTEEPESTKTSSALSGYQFKGLANIGYDSLGKIYWVSYSVPNDYSWGTDILSFNAGNIFTGFGGGTYTKPNDTTYINEVNWHAATPWGFNVRLGYKVSADSVKALFCDTLLNLASYSSTGKLFVVYATGKNPNITPSLAKNQIRLFMFE